MASKQKLSWFLKAMLFLGLAFLYIPLIILVVYSFNDSKLVTIWGGFSTKWYAKLLNNDQILEAAWLSLRIAVVSSLAATVLGTLAGYALGARPLKIFFVITLPLIMPAIISGFLLGVTLSLDDLVITSFLSGPGSSTLPQVIFSKIKLGLDPQMNVLATIIIAIVGTLVIIMNWYMMRQTTRREREAAEAERQERLAMEQAIHH